MQHGLICQWRYKIALAVLIFLQLVLTVVAAWQTISSRSMTNEEYQTAATKELMPVAVAQAFLCFILMSMLLAQNSVNNRIMQIPDPISDAILLSSLLLFNYIQRLCFRMYLLKLIIDPEITSFNGKDWQTALIELTNVRLTMMSMEMLFFIIPLSQNLLVSSLQM